MTLQEAMTVVAAKLPVEDINIQRRLNRAYDILISRGYTITKSLRHSEYVWHVHKASTAAIASGEDSSALYTVDHEGCNCPDASSVRSGLCKHRIATMIMREMEKR